MFEAHCVGDSLKNLRKFLVIVPMGMVIPPSMKAIIGMTTSFVFLSSNYSPCAAYLTPTCRGILYLDLKLLILSSVYTKYLNLPIFYEVLQGKFRKVGIKAEESSGRLTGVRNGHRTRFLYL